MKMRTMIPLVLSVAVIVLCAYLPNIVSWQLDRKYDNQVQFAPVSDIRLEFADRDRSLKETVGMLGDIKDTVDIPAELASMKEDAVHRLAGETIEDYRAAGLMEQDATFVMQSIQPVLIYGSGESRNNVFWFVNFYDYKLGLYAHFTIDDRSGSVVSVEFGNTVGDAYTRQEMEYILGNFSQVYLEGLGEEFYEYDAAQLLEQAKAPNDGSYLANSIYYFAEDYRECSITFFVNTNGFYTYIS